MMAVRPQRKPTAAEEAILARFEDVASELRGDEAVAAARREAIRAFERDGLPTRKVEAWHYTDLRTAMRQAPSAEVAAAGRADALVADHIVIDLRDVARGEPAAGMSVRDMGELLSAGQAFLAPGRPYDTIGQINAAFVQGGAAIDVGAGVTVAKPVELHASSGGAQTHLRSTVTVGGGATLTLIERHLPVADEVLDTSVTDLIVGEGAHVVYVIDQARGAGAYHLGQLNASLGRDARLTLVMLQAGARVSRQELHVDVLGEGADFQLRGINLLGDEALIDTTMVVNHAVPNTTSEEIFRNVGTGRGRGVFQGQIKVAQVAQKTDAKMSCNTLLLSDEASFAAKPELEIFADDVACGHGATVDDLEPTHLFYLMARGIPEREARALLVKGFVDEMLEILEDAPELAGALEAKVDGWLEAHA